MINASLFYNDKQFYVIKILKIIFLENKLTEETR